MCRQRQLAAEVEAASVTPVADKPVVTRQQRRAKSGLTFKEKHELQALELEIENLEEQRQQAEDALAQPQNCSLAQLAEIGKNFTDLEEKLQQGYARWEELELKQENV
jgi:ATP-binding cassette subfamily F protein uup